MGKLKKSTVSDPAMVPEQNVSGCEHNVNCVPSLQKFCYCILKVPYEIHNAVNDNTFGSPKAKLDHFKTLKRESEFILTIFNQTIVDYLSGYIGYLKDVIEEESQAKDKQCKLNIPKVVLSPESYNKGIINGTALEFGMSIGNVMAHLENDRGERLIQMDAVDLAKVLPACFEFGGGKALNEKTLAINLGIGKNEESLLKERIIKPEDVLKYKKKR